jgi:hypothetical protein
MIADWITHLTLLLNRHGSAAMIADAASMTVAELWGLYQSLLRRVPS